MKRFVGILAFLLMTAFAFSASADEMRVFTVELYDASNAYIASSTATGGVQTAPSGTSTFTWSAKGQFPNTEDNRTIDLYKYSPRVGTITASVHSHPDTWDGGKGPDGSTSYESGVSLVDTPDDPATNVFQIGAAFSDIDSDEAWSGASIYWFFSKARSGTTETAQKLEHDETGVVFGRYMRTFWSGVSAVICPQAIIGVMPK